MLKNIPTAHGTKLLECERSERVYPFGRGRQNGFLGWPSLVKKHQGKVGHEHKKQGRVGTMGGRDRKLGKGV